MKPIPLFSLILATTTAGGIGNAQASDRYEHLPQRSNLGDLIVRQLLQGLASAGYANESAYRCQPSPWDQGPAPKKQYKHRPNAWKIVGGQFPRGRKIPQGWHSISWFQSRGFDVNRLLLVNEDGQYYRGHGPGPGSCASREQGGHAPHPGYGQGGSCGSCAGGNHHYGGGHAGNQGGCRH